MRLDDEARRIRKEHVDAFEKNAEVIAAMDEILFSGQLAS